MATMWCGSPVSGRAAVGVVAESGEWLPSIRRWTGDDAVEADQDRGNNRGAIRRWRGIDGSAAGLRMRDPAAPWWSASNAAVVGTLVGSSEG